MGQASASPGASLRAFVCRPSLAAGTRVGRAETPRALHLHQPLRTRAAGWPGLPRRLAARREHLVSAGVRRLGRPPEAVRPCGEPVHVAGHAGVVTVRAATNAPTELTGVSRITPAAPL